MVEITVNADKIYLLGDLKVNNISSLWQRLNLLLKELKTDQVTIDLSGITGIDSAGVAFLDETKATLAPPAWIIRFDNIPPAIQQAIASFSSEQLPAEVSVSAQGFFESLGEKTFQLKDKIIDLLYLSADIFYWSIVGIFQRKGQREGAFTQQSLLIGVDSLKILGLMTFLIGLVLALQSAAQLRQFGADIFVADLIGISMLREMGPIMTAIIIAGRSGSAIASEIATMVVTEEVDALKTMALNPVRYIMVPKFHAITITMPLLTVFADIIGIFGGFVIGVFYLQLGAAAFLNELLTAVILKDVLTGLFKSLIFAWIIVIIGCYYGTQVKGGAEGVGKATTASVVASIFLVVIADALLGLLFYFE